MTDDRDAFFMRKALRLAERGRGRTSPNPMVGALVVDGDGVIVGRGSHEQAGGPHAEVHALRDAGNRAHGATLYCTLEPCAHTGRTPPCAPAVLHAGIARAVIAMEEPNPAAAGGAAWLRAHGVDISTGVLRAEARELNAPFITRIATGRPYVTMKVALSLDGRIAAAPGRRTALTSAAANRLVHRDRAEVDAVAVGAGTVLADDPELTPRGAYRARPLVRVVYDRDLVVSPSARLLTTLRTGPVVFVTTPSAGADNRADALRARGAEILPLDEADLLTRSLQALADRGVTSLVVEGGAELHQGFWDAGLVDRVQMYVSGHVLGDGGVRWLPSVLTSPRMARRTAVPVGSDVLLEGYVHRAD